ncbi:MAG: YggS family pyridoxal phosphate-dependent enzyme [Isosphaerales bacterium]
MNEERIRHNLDTVLRRIAEAALRSGRQPDAVRLVAVTKKCSPDWIEALVASGARDLGENYPQELWRKIDALADLGDSVRWHLIGHLQSNKVKKTLPLVRMIHSVDSLKLLRVIEDSARALDHPPGVCLQVNTSAEESKHGWTEEQILSEAESIAACRSIPIAGLMTMAGLETTAETARVSFRRLRVLGETLRGRTGLPLPELSMGMSNDFEAAIEEGATLVRVGTALFEGVLP